jgi:CBS domain-containing protein
VFECHERDRVEHCASLMRDHNVGFIPVVDDDGRVVGIVTDRDLTVRVLAEGLPPDIVVSEVMTHDVRVCHPSDPLRWAEEKMMTHRKSRLVVVDDEGRCVGVLSLADLAQAEKGGRTGKVLRVVTQREVCPH